MKRIRFTRRSRLIAIAFSTVALLTIVGVVLAAINIDSFDVGTLNVAVLSSGPTTNSGIDATGTPLGGDREVVLTWISGAGAANIAIDNSDTNRLNFNQDNGVKSRAILRWDGADAQATVNNQNLGDIDLTVGGNDGFHFEVVNDDIRATVRFRVYSNAGADWSQYVLNLPGGINFPAHVDFFVPFGTGWTIGGGGGANFGSVSSIEIEIDGTVLAGADVSVDFFDADNFREYGDLPGAAESGPVVYPASIVDAFQVPQGLRLGSNVDVDATSQPDIPAGSATSGDDNTTTPGDVDDEDGVTPSPGINWAAGAGGGQVDFTVAGCATFPTPCRLNGWIDWNSDGDFNDTREHVFNDYALSFNATYFNTLIDVPDTQTFNQSFYARFRVCNSAGQCNTPDATNILNGEIEDYLWTFGPLAVTLDSLSARSAQNGTALLILGATVALGAVGVIALRRRK